ncbi:hypothetical protein EDB92DRAFT_1868909 [Lactarius akahatsu]|uniref:Uncharacterized protein n=1 Tax=Lactarius akahatsu TaxID=416441 RepID=A0AAD4LH71_9AGAM|nr:hypothetical protein EDB92DRAFT_1868909 [Lactarius akahatsu]
MFGLLRSFSKLALCRFLSGALNGNVGVSKRVLAELTGYSNVARGFSLLPLVAVIGYTHPTDTSHAVDLSLAVSYHDLRTAGRTPSHTRSGPNTNTSSHVWRWPSKTPSLISSLADDSRGSPPERTSSRLEEDAEQPQPLRALLTRPVLTSVANYIHLARAARHRRRGAHAGLHPSPSAGSA